MKQFLTKAVDFLTLGISYAVRTFKLYKTFVVLADINKDGKVSKAELEKLTKALADGSATITIKYKNKK